MSPATQEHIDQMRKTVHEVLAGKTSSLFLGRIDKIIDEWGAGKLTAAQTCEKVQKAVSLFIGEEPAKQIGERCAPLVMRDSAAKK